MPSPALIHRDTREGETNTMPDVTLEKLQAATVAPAAEEGMNDTARADFWAIVLAGGQGVRLRSLVRQAFGDDRPKQYARLLGPRSLLRQTLDRVSLAIPAERSVVVTMPQHAGYIAEEFAIGPHPHVLMQPSDRGTAAGVLYPAHRIAWQAPDATVAVFPSDHLVVGDASFMEHVAHIASWLDSHPDRVVLLGAQPTVPETEYGWIEPGESLGELTSGNIRSVRQFVEKPSLPKAKACLAAGHLWNTSVIVAKVATLLELGRVGLPALHDRLARLRGFAGTPDEPAAVRQAYELMPRANFSRDILEACPEALAVSKLPRLVWSDLGSPSRVLDAVTRMPTPPDWAERLLRSS